MRDLTLVSKIRSAGLLGLGVDWHVEEDIGKRHSFDDERGGPQGEHEVWLCPRHDLPRWRAVAIRFFYSTDSELSPAVQGPRVLWPFRSSENHVGPLRQSTVS